MHNLSNPVLFQIWKEYITIESLLIECFGKIFGRLREGIYNFSLAKDDLDTVAYDIEELLER